MIRQWWIEWAKIKSTNDSGIHELFVDACWGTRKFDDKLFEYTLIIEGFEADKVNEKIYDNISKKFDNEQVHDKQAYETQSISWENTDLKVDYRLTEQSSWRFTAVVRFSYKPMFNKIRQEKLNEEKNLFWWTSVSWTF